MPPRKQRAQDGGTGKPIVGGPPPRPRPASASRRVSGTQATAVAIGVNMMKDNIASAVAKNVISTAHKPMTAKGAARMLVSAASAASEAMAKAKGSPISKKPHPRSI